MSPGAVDRHQLGKRVPGPAGIQRDRHGRTTASSSRSSCRTARRPRASPVDWPVLKSSVADDVTSMLTDVVAHRHRRRARRSRAVRRRQDGHDRELRRRLVRRLDATRSRSRSGSATPTSSSRWRPSSTAQPVAGGTYPAAILKTFVEQAIALQGLRHRGGRGRRTTACRTRPRTTRHARDDPGTQPRPPRPTAATERRRRRRRGRPAPEPEQPRPADAGARRRPRSRRRRRRRPSQPPPPAQQPAPSTGGGAARADR